MAAVSGEQLVSTNAGQGDFVATPHRLRQQPGGDGRIVGVRLVERSDNRLEDVSDVGPDVDPCELCAVLRGQGPRQLRLIGR